MKGFCLSLFFPPEHCVIKAAGVRPAGAIEEGSAELN